MDPTPEDDAELSGVDTDIDAEPTRVEVDSDYVPHELTEIDGLEQQDTSVAPTERPRVGVDPTPEDDAELSGVDTVFDADPTAVEVDSDYVPHELSEVDGLGQQDTSVAPTERPRVEPSTTPAVETHAPSPKKRMSARNARNRKQPEKYVPSMQGNKYAVALTQIAASLKGSKHAMPMTQMSVKLMSKGAYRKADRVGMIMAQLSMKAAIKK